MMPAPKSSTRSLVTWFRPVAPALPGPAAVRERARPYEEEGSVRQARGAVSVAAGAWWSATLATPLRDGGAPDEPAVLTIERHGSDGGRAGQRVELFVRFDELESLVTLLDGVLRHARRDGVVPPGGSRASGPDR